MKITYTKFPRRLAQIALVGAILISYSASSSNLRDPLRF